MLRGMSHAQLASVVEDLFSGNEIFLTERPLTPDAIPAIIEVRLLEFFAAMLMSKPNF